MGGLGVWEILVILVILLVIFGAGKLPKVMGDLGSGIRNFKANLSDPNKAEPDAPPPAKTDDAPKA
ncbi:twin-arginine translocase TatA/TatE family subunit [Niveispirillum lacus]|uniref:Sec-independent protein translocase protein TatA n=1 Tax=Niveispirillum lacus TaxID=1981099 RepID=A0A255Z8F5_9PROT|nr:twin-arginine translocase TatA/TatE family subunit [Niveispirillum lacus]OYQ37712.1 twin-arginine translocase TatA/TatE family subunit [Niveispirillum lacus]